MRPTVSGPQLWVFFATWLELKQVGFYFYFFSLIYKQYIKLLSASAFNMKLVNHRREMSPL